MKNFYPNQYSKDKIFDINHNYLTEQFSDYEEIFSKIKDVIKNNDFTLGKCVDDVETLISKECKTKEAIAVGSGTDALMLSLKVLGIKDGDEVITCTYTFYATVGAIVTAGAKPIFCDCDEDYNIDVNKIRNKITSKTKAIIPIHWSGRPCNIDELRQISQEYSIPIVEDACHALQAEYKGERCGGFGELGCFSFHPLKNLNVWGDGGIIVTNNVELSNRLKLIRNHGLVERNVCQEFSYNSRLDTIQAVVAKHIIEKKLSYITKKRIDNARLYDKYLSDVPDLKLQKRSEIIKKFFPSLLHSSKKRDQLASFLQENGVDAKIHYPIPMHLQPASKRYNYSLGDFPIAEKLAQNTISLPVHEFINEKQIYLVCELIKKFY